MDVRTKRTVYRRPLPAAAPGCSVFPERDFGGWMSPGTRADASQLIFVGPNSQNPGLKPYPRDLNNFGPAIGFAWNATSNTVVRGGYQIQYIGGGNFTGVEGALGQPPGSEFLATYQGDSNHPYLDLTSITKNQIPYPIAPPVLPVQQIPLTSRTATIQAYDPNYVNPYIQNLTLSITKDVNRHLTLDARYIGTLTRKNYQFVRSQRAQLHDQWSETSLRCGACGTRIRRCWIRCSKALTSPAPGLDRLARHSMAFAQTGALELRNNSTLSSQPRQWKLRGTGRTVVPAELQHISRFRATRVCRLCRLASTVPCSGTTDSRRISS